MHENIFQQQQVLAHFDYKASHARQNSLRGAVQVRAIGGRCCRERCYRSAALKHGNCSARTLRQRHYMAPCIKKEANEQRAATRRYRSRNCQYSQLKPTEPAAGEATGDADGAWDAEGDCEHDAPDIMRFVAPAAQQGQGPEHSGEESPAVAPYVPAGQGTGEPAPAAQ
jgi:hypothetical protein